MLMGINGVIGSTPIAHDNALIPPGIAQGIHEKIFVIAAMNPVDDVIGRHHRPWVRFFHNNLEGFKVDFVHRPFIHD